MISRSTSWMDALLRFGCSNDMPCSLVFLLTMQTPLILGERGNHATRMVTRFSPTNEESDSMSEVVTDKDKEYEAREAAAAPGAEQPKRRPCEQPHAAADRRDVQAFHDHGLGRSGARDRAVGVQQVHPGAHRRARRAVPGRAHRDSGRHAKGAFQRLAISHSARTPRSPITPV